MMSHILKTIRKYTKKVHKDLAVIPTAKAPGIPSKKLAQTAYTGRGQDTVGPAAYNPKADLTLKNFGETDFAVSKTQRKPFDPSEALKAMPGPGTHDFVMIDKKTHNQTGQDCNFTSKVPNTAHTGPKVYHDNYRFKPNNPGPGEYKITQTIEEATNQHKRANSEGAYIG